MTPCEGVCVDSLSQSSQQTKYSNSSTLAYEHEYQLRRLDYIYMYICVYIYIIIHLLTAALRQFFEIFCLGNWSPRLHSHAHSRTTVCSTDFVATKPCNKHSYQHVSTI